jgi:Tol biopolymer transport system component
MGKSVDQRADIWAFGVILYELLTGRRPFRGDDLPQIIASVIGQPPDLTPIPPRVRPLVERCLEKDPRKRLRHIGDAGLLLADETATATRTPRSVLLMGALAMVAVALAAYSLLHDRGAVPLPPQPARMSVLLPEKSRVQSLAVSPDGREIAMVLVKEGKQQIWVRPLEALEATPLAGTDDATNPFWSPDSQYIAFFADARLKKVGHSGGPVQVLCDALGALGGTWNRNGDILIGALARVEKVSASGGNLSPLPKHAAVAEFYPVFLPDGQHYLAIRDNYSPEPGVWLSSTDGPDARRILPDVSNVAIVEPPSGSHVGQVLFTRANTLMALPFDMKQLKTAGDPFPVAQSIAASSPAHWLAAASGPGVLAYVSGQHGMNQYVWRDRRGKVLGVEPDAGGVVAISPDGKRLTGDRNGQVWVLEFGRDIATRLTFGRGANNPIWSSDGRYVAYWSGGMGIYRKLANGAGAEEALLRTEKLAPPKSWSPDGRFLLYAQITKGASSDLMAIAVEPGAKPFAVADTPANEDQGQFSPDGHWVAYTSNESGVSEIYVVPFPPSTEGGKWLVSRGGGVQARWRRDGKELLYISPDSKMMSVEVNTQPVFQAGTPQPLFATEIVDTGIRTGPMSWDLAPDGNRFLIISESSTDASLTVALNWQPGPK